MRLSHKLRMGLAERRGRTHLVRASGIGQLARSFGRSSGIKTAAQARTISIVGPARSPHEAVNMVRTPTTTLYRHAFSKPALGRARKNNGKKPTDRGVRPGGVRREPRFRVGASLPVSANWGNAWGTTGSSRAAIATSTRRLAYHMRTWYAIPQESQDTPGFP